MTGHPPLPHALVAPDSTGADILLPSRRDVLGLALSAALTSAAGAQSLAPSAGPIHLVAIRRLVKLGSPEQPESTVFRLVPAAELAPGARPPAHPLALPVIRARHRAPLALVIENRLDQPLAFHARGMRQANAQDGVPGLVTTPIAPGDTREITLSTQQSGTFFLAPVVPAHAPEQNARGLQAIIIVEEPEPPPVDHDIAFAVGDIRVSDSGLLDGSFGTLRDAARLGKLGNRLTANGQPAPGRMSVRPGARIRLRLVNVSNARMIPLRVNNLDARVVAIDSTPCTPFDPLKRTVIVAPGSRIDLICDAPRKTGETGIVEARLGNGVPIFAFQSEGAPLPERAPAGALPDPGLPPAIRLQAALRKDMVITGGLPREIPYENASAAERAIPSGTPLFRINGQPGGFSGKPLAILKRDQVLVLAMVNRTAWPQVIAVHGHSFRLLHPFDDGWEPYFLDTLYLTPGTTARIALIASNPGRWALRSTIAEHYAAGVQGWFEVT